MVRAMGFGTLMATTKTSPNLQLPLQFLAAWIGVWLGRVLQEQVDYLKEENRLLREKLGTKRVVLTDAERRRLATLGKALGRKVVLATCLIPKYSARITRDRSARTPSCAETGSGKIVVISSGFSWFARRGDA